MKGMHRAATGLLVVTALFLLLIASIAVPVSAAPTTELTITKLASDDKTILDQKSITWEWMRDNLDVQGDGETMYYNQGPIFEGAWEKEHPGQDYDYWNPTEDVNLEYKDHGEFMGTDVKDLCDLVGGAAEGEMVEIKACDGMYKTWPAEYIYAPNPRQGKMVIAWYHGKDTGYIDEGFTEGMRLYFLAETTNDAGKHVWGNWDMHESWDEEYWYFFNNQYPSASGNSVYHVDRIIIHSEIDPDQGGSSSGGDGGSSKPRGLEGAALTRTLHGTVNGSVSLIQTGGEAQTIAAGETAHFSLNTTGLENVESACLYLFGTNNTAKDDAKREDISTLLNSQQLGLSEYYADLGPDGDDPAVETWCYDLKASVPEGNLSLDVKNNGPEETSLTLYGGVLFAVVRDDRTSISYWVAEGADAIEADPSAGVDEEGATSTAEFPDEVMRDGEIDARVFSVVTGASGNDTYTNCLTFHDGEWMNLLDGGEKAISIGEAEVTSYLRPSGNTLAVSSVSYDERGDYLENRLAVLIVGTRDAEPTPEPTTMQTTAPPTLQTTSSPPPTTLSDDGKVDVDTAQEGSFWSGLLGWLHGIPLIGSLFPAPTAAVTASPSLTPAPVIEPVSTPTPSLPENAPLNIITYPAGAQVVLDGEYLGMITPARLEALPTGAHSLELVLEGYRPYATTFDLTEETDVTVALESARSNINVDPACLELLTAQGTDLDSGGIYVDATDGGATIYIDSKKIEGTTPQVVNGLKEGRHKVKVKKDKASYKVDTREVWVTPGTIVPVYFDRYEQSMTRTVTLDASTFKGEYCAVNGHPTGKKMPAKVKVPVLNAFASFYHDGAYFSIPVPGYAGDGETVSLNEMPGLTTFKVDSKPSGAEIFIDGFETGHATPYLLENISYGCHGVMVTKPGYLPKEEEVHIPKGTDDRSVTFNLETYAHGALYVNSTPAGAKIYLYGANTGEVTPHLFTGMDLGKYTVKVVGRSDSKTVEDVMVVPDRMVTCEVRLRK
ncbi:PEGA domain-containing protein [Methanofollis aquaemaris]|uniref:PEGA domain-containing protein n=1 Tax=Methanofollis aquaemaris TaxID=126734 RepID=A0A8A3S344_9EURY|nr:PEGA domain-containing protein [Methanofollis aquaemaris]QSZ66555.1 PEGA domain-containing protein [Methanofollis aquaemaris]